MLRIAWPSSRATDSCLIFLQHRARSPLSGMVLVMITWSIGAASSRSIAGPESTPWTAHASTRSAPLALSACGRLHDRARRVDDVVLDDARPSADVADHVHHFRRPVIGAPLVDDRQFRIQPLGVGPGALGAAGIRRHDRQVRVAPTARSDR